MSPTAGMLLVVGAGPGLGLAAARRFGGRVTRSASSGATPNVDPHGRAAGRGWCADRAATADVTDAGALESAIARLRDRHGLVQIMLFSPRPDIAWIKPVLGTTPADLTAALGLSVAAAAMAVRAVVPDMQRLGRGTLLFTTGGAAVEPHRDRAVSGVAYGAESAYVRMLHDALTGDGVHVAQVTVVGAIGHDGPHRPDAVAGELWRRHTLRDQPLVVLRPHAR